MGKPKLLLPWGQTSILGHLIRRWKELRADQITVTCAARDLTVCAELDRLSFPQQNRIANPDTDRGMFSSIICAAQWHGWRDSLSHWAIVLGDQPHIRSDTLEQLLNFAAKHPQQVCQPSRNGKKGHPVIVPKPVFLQIGKSTSADLKEFLAGQEVAQCQCNDAGQDLDIDRPEDYQQALALDELRAKGTRS